ncbi:hypothetical protein TNCV_4181871 [Trichonephila clavipes]|nr:hypothetical protein TNCV_4181871 [Trichonephila clavipes]
MEAVKQKTAELLKALTKEDFQHCFDQWKKRMERNKFINYQLPYGRVCEPLARMPLMARGTIFWARHRSKRSTTFDSSIKEFSVRLSQIKKLSETFKFIMYPDVTWFDRLNLPQFNWLEIEEFESQLTDF